MQDRVLGWVGGAMIVTALGLLLFGGAPDEGAVAEGPPPQLHLLSPTDGDTIAGNLELRFTSERPIGTQPGGWGADGYHVHAEIDGREAMPGGADIRRVQDGAYIWSIPRVPSGELTVRLFWSDAQHAPVPDGGSEEIDLHVL